MLRSGGLASECTDATRKGLASEATDATKYQSRVVSLPETLPGQGRVHVDKADAPENPFQSADEWFKHQEKELKKQRILDDGRPESADPASRKTTHYNRFKHRFRVGCRLEPVGPRAVAQGEPERTLERWFDACEFKVAACLGSPFAVTKLPASYSAVADRTGQNWIYHPRTRILIWPVRLRLGQDEEPEGCVTLYHYTSEKSLMRMASCLARGEHSSEIVEELAKAVRVIVSNARGSQSSLAGTYGVSAANNYGFQGPYIPATALEPQKYCRHRDVLREVIGPKVEIKGKLWNAGTHCVVLLAPYRALQPNGGGLNRPDRVRVYASQLGPLGIPECLPLLRCLAGFKRRVARKRRRIIIRKSGPTTVAELLATSQRPDNSLRLDGPEMPDSKEEQRQNYRRGLRAQQRRRREEGEMDGAAESAESSNGFYRHGLSGSGDHSHDDNDEDADEDGEDHHSEGSESGSSGSSSDSESGSSGKGPVEGSAPA